MHRISLPSYSLIHESNNNQLLVLDLPVTRHLPSEAQKKGCGSRDSSNCFPQWKEAPAAQRKKGSKRISSPRKGNDFLALSHRGIWRHCSTEVEPMGLRAQRTPIYLNSNLHAIQAGRSKLYLGPAACCSMNLSFRGAQGQWALSPVIQFFLYLVFTAPYRHSGQVNVSFRVL